MSYFEEIKNIKYIHTKKKSTKDILYLLVKKVDAIKEKLNNKK